VPRLGIASGAALVFLAGLRGVGPHLLHPVRCGPRFGFLLVGVDAESMHPLGSQRLHRVAHIALRFIDDGHAAEDASMLREHVEEIAVVELVKAHLDEHDAAHALGLALSEELFRRETRGLHLLLFEAGREGIALNVRSPDVDMRVDPFAIGRGWRRASGGREGGECRGAKKLPAGCAGGCVHVGWLYGLQIGGEDAEKPRDVVARIVTMHGDANATGVMHDMHIFALQRGMQFRASGVLKRKDA